MKTVSDLRADGYKVMVYVQRVPYDAQWAIVGREWLYQDVMELSVPLVDLRKDTSKLKIWGRGGITEMVVWTPEHKEEEGAEPDYRVSAVCSAKDQFRKKVGHMICLGRLEKLMAGEQLDWPKEYERRD